MGDSELIRSTRMLIRETAKRVPLHVAHKMPTHFQTLEKLVRHAFGPKVDMTKLWTMLSPTFSRVYSPADADYGFRGGRKFSKPRGWLRFAIQMREPRNDWCVAYHGTQSSNI